MDSCIVFLYDKQNINIKSFLNEILKYKTQDIQDISYDNKFQPNLDNIRVITSEICGLGKSEKIKEMINEKQYYYFPLGGILTKSIIFDKLSNLLNKMKNENYKDIAIHLDLTESEETSLLNEFFFLFLLLNFIQIMKVLFIFQRKFIFILKFQIVLKIIYPNMIY